MSRKFSRRNYSEALDKLVPQIYNEEDLKLAEEKQDLPSKILDADADLVLKFLDINGLIYDYSDNDGRTYPTLNLEFSSWNTSSYSDRTASSTNAYSGYSEGLVKYFIPQNKLTEITPSEFDLEILSPLGYDINDYETSAAFRTFVSGTLLPQLQLGSGPASSPSPAVLPTEFGSTHDKAANYLIDSLGLFALMNYDQYYTDKVRELISDKFTDKFYNFKKTVTLGDALEVLKRLSFVYTDLQPRAWNDEFRVSATTHLSGTQSLDKYLTWNNILYDLPLTEEDETFTKDFYIKFFEDKNFTIPYVTEGPLKKFLTAMGFLIGDIDNEVLSLESLNSIEECPAKYLPYLADQIGWEFYTSNSESWRRQLRDARKLLQKKGTKQGLIDLLKSILPATEIDFDNGFSEYYESYIPYLIYYLLKTEADQLESFSVWNQTKANEFAGGEFDPSDLDKNIRFVVDHILLEAVYEFSDLFNIQGYAFAPDNPKFTFNYRDRDFNIPPFEDERFYKDCDLTYDLVKFFKEKMVCLGVEDSICDSFESYILSNTIDGDQDPKLYNNGFLFLTESLQQAPNYDRVITDLESKLYDYLPLWNGKSSQFTLQVSSGTFDDKFFVQTAYTTEDFFESLKAISDFVPAKAIERVDVNLRRTDALDSFTNTYPRASYRMLDTPSPSGAMASFEISTLNMRSNVLGLVGSSVDPNYVKDPRSTNDYSALPVFKRDRLSFSRTSTNDAYIDVSSVYTVSGPYEEVAPRTAVRRRDLQKNLSKGQIFRRDGFNPPSFLNTTTKGTGTSLTALGDLSSFVEYIPLGLIPSSYTFTPVPDHKNVPEVYDECQTTASNDVFNGVRSKYTFKTRGAVDTYNLPLDHGYANNLVFKYRDNLDEIYKLIVDLKDEDLELQAKLTVDNNLNVIKNINWKDEYESIKNSLWNDLDYSIENDFNKMRMDFYKRLPNEMNKTFHYLYLNDYVKQGRGSLSNATLDDVIYGGASLISHIYGPTFFNALHKLDGSAVGNVLASIDADRDTVFDRKTEIINNKIKSLNEDFEFQIRYCDNNLSDTDFQVGTAPESFSQNYISGVEIHTWKNSAANKMFVYDLSSDEGFLSENSTLLDGNLLGMKSKEFLPRLKYTFKYKEAGDTDNFLRPEHNFSVELSSLFLREDSFQTDQRTASVWIHTEKETDFYGKSIFWNYMPDGTWKIIDSSSVEGSEGIAYVRNNLVHNFAHSKKTIENKVEINSCYIDNVNREVLYSLVNEDFDVDKVHFNTLNRHIAVPLSYYQYKQQVHRSDQNYMIEVFPSLTQDDSQFWATKGIKCVDETMRLRASVQKSFEIPDYSLSLTDTQKKVEFFYPDGGAVPLGTTVYITRDGEVYDGPKELTISVSKGGKRILYSKAFIGTTDYVPNTDGEIEYREVPYEGYAQINGYNPWDVIVIQGKITSVELLNIVQNNVIKDSTLSSFGFTGDMIEAVQVRKDPRISGGISESRYTDLGFTPLTTSTVFTVTNVKTETPFGDNYAILSANGMDFWQTTELMASYIKNDIGGSYLFNTGQISLNPELSSNYLSNEEVVQSTSFGETSGYVDTDSRTATTDHHNFFIEASKKDRFDNQYDFPRDLVFYEPISDGTKNNFVILTAVFAVTDNSPSRIGLDMGIGGFSPHHQNNRTVSVVYNVSGTSSGFTEKFSCEPSRSLDINSRAIRPSAGTLNDFIGVSEFPFVDDIRELRYPVAPFGTLRAGMAGGYDVDNKWKLMFIAIDCKKMEEFSQNYPNIDSYFPNRAAETLNTPAKLAFSMMMDQDQSVSSGSVEIAHLGIHSDMLDPDYQFPLSYFTNTTVLNSQTNSYPSIRGTELGNYITKTVDQEFVRKPRNLLSIFRFYNDIADDLQSRDNTKTEKMYGPNGGGRSNYRIHPAEFADSSTFLSNGRIDNLNITN